MTSVEMVRLSPSEVGFKAQSIVDLIYLAEVMAWYMDSNTIE